MAVELVTQRVLKAIHGLLHRGDDGEQSGDRVTESLLDLRGLPECGRLQLPQDPLDQVRVVAPSTALQHGHGFASGQG